MKSHRLGITLLLSILMLAIFPQLSVAAPIKIIVMQDKAGDVDEYAPLVEYLKGHGVEAELVSASDYNMAAAMFASGKADAMFSGSGVAGTLIIKDLAKPLVRPVADGGWSTDWAVVVARKGAPPYSGDPEYFRNKRVVYCGLASSGEFYYRSVTLNVPYAATRKAKSHFAALALLAMDGADVAIVKNRVWDNAKASMLNLMLVGGDTGENPNGTLMVSVALPDSKAAELKSILLDLGSDESTAAKNLKFSLGVSSYIETTPGDFKHTLKLLKKAGVTESFRF